jgi:hypothetical protein
MRSLAPIALLGGLITVTAGQAQSLAEHAAAASGATIGTAAGKPLSNAITKIFGQTETTTKKAASASTTTKTPAKQEVGSAPRMQAAPQVAPQDGGGGALPSLAGSSTPSRHGGFAPRRIETEYASINPQADVVVAAPEPIRKEPTIEEIASIQVGATEEQVVSALGQPESKVTIPDDGHLVQICQYWSKGRQLGTVRLDNGQVVNVQARTQN